MRPTLAYRWTGCTGRRCECILFRKSEHTLREGSRHRRAVHAHGCGPQTGTADGSPPVRTEGAVSIARRAEEHHAPRAQRKKSPAARARDHALGDAATLPMGWMVAPGTAANCPTVPTCAQACVSHSPCVRDARARVPRAGGGSGCIWSDGSAAWPSKAALVCGVHGQCARSAAAAPALTT